MVHVLHTRHPGWHNGPRGSLASPMMARANSLTQRVTTPRDTPVTLPAHDLRVMIDGLGELGYDIGTLMAAAGVTRDDLGHSDARVRCEAYGAAIDRARRERFTTVRKLTGGSRRRGCRSATASTIATFSSTRSAARSTMGHRGARKLAEAGVSYQKLLDDARKEAAARYVSESTLAVGEIARLLGYSEPAPFHRASRRRFNTTPDSFRSR
jgi:AraC-like DNA-binding protein